MNKKYSEIIFTLAKLDKSVIYYDNFQSILNRVNECVMKTQIYSRSENCVIPAEPGLGKTFIAELLISLMKSEEIVENDCDITTVPAFYIEVPSNATPLKLSVTMLAALGEPLPIKGNIVEQTHRLIKLFKRCRIKLVLIDEFQNMMNKTQKTCYLSKGVIEWVKELSNASQVTYCLLGSEEFLPYLMQNDHTKKRFMDVLPLKRLTPPSQSEDGTLAQYYYSYSAIAKTHFPHITLPNAEDDHFIRQLYLATNGIPKYISLFVKLAIEKCLVNQETSVSLKYFGEVWDRYRNTEVSRTLRNPFLLDAKALAMAVRGGN
jgi:hypothetical protein